MWWGATCPWTLAGHARGGWSLHEDGAVEPRPFPGVAGVETPLGWLDSVAVLGGAGTGWEGFEATLARLEMVRRMPAPAAGRRRAQADFVLGSGSSAYDENALSLARGDSVAWWRLGAASGNRGGVGALGDAGRHHYEAMGRWTGGRQRLAAAFASRGSAASLAHGAEQAATGAGGRLTYGFGLGAQLLAVTLGRTYDHHESFGEFLPNSRRDAQERMVAAELTGDTRAWGVRAEVRDAEVVRVTEGEPRVEAAAQSVWLGLRAEGQRGPARFDAALGVGRHGGPRRTEVAPSLGFTFVDGPFQGRLFLARVLVPVWTDLAAGQEAFLQSTWAGGFELGLGQPRTPRARLGWLMGRTRDRAVATRFPFEELWLRKGFRADPKPYDFGLGTLATEWTLSAWTAAAETYLLFRDSGDLQPEVDPRRGGRATLEARLAAFRDDLVVRWRGEVEAVGGRESELDPPRWLGGFVSFGAGAAFTLADATLTIRVRNLEDQRRPQAWEDLRTGQEAVGAGREFRLVLTWRLYN